MRRRLRAKADRATVQLGLRLTEREREEIEVLVTSLRARSAAEVIKRALAELANAHERELSGVQGRAPGPHNDRAESSGHSRSELVTQWDARTGWTAALRRVHVEASYQASSPESALAHLRNWLMHHAGLPPGAGTSWSEVIERFLAAERETLVKDRRLALPATASSQPPTPDPTVNERILPVEASAGPRREKTGSTVPHKVASEERPRKLALRTLNAELLALEVTHAMASSYGSELLYFFLPARDLELKGSIRRASSPLFEALRFVADYAIQGKGSVERVAITTNHLLPLLRRSFHVESTDLAGVAREVAALPRHQELALMLMALQLRLSLASGQPVRLGVLASVCGLSRTQAERQLGSRGLRLGSSSGDSSDLLVTEAEALALMAERRIAGVTAPKTRSRQLRLSPDS
jgi:hypothetical protein